MRVLLAGLLLAGCVAAYVYRVEITGWLLAAAGVRVMWAYGRHSLGFAPRQRRSVLAELAVGAAGGWLAGRRRV